MGLKGKWTKISVTCLNLEEHWRKHFGDTRCHVLKVDIEGSELNFLKAEQSFLKLADSIVLEWHKWRVSLGECRYRNHVSISCISAFDHLYKAFREFLQTLFIARRTYPLAYNKWVRLQVEQWLGLAELYRGLAPILSVRNIESVELLEKAAGLKALLERWVQPG